MRVRTDMWVSALIRCAQNAGAFAAVVARGDDAGGSVIVKVNRLDGRADVFAAASYADEGASRWYTPIGDAGTTQEADVDAYLARARDRDPDLWVVEIEDRAGRSFLEAFDF